MTKLEYLKLFVERQVRCWGDFLVALKMKYKLYDEMAEKIKKKCIVSRLDKWGKIRRKKGTRLVWTSKEGMKRFRKMISDEASKWKERSQKGCKRTQLHWLIEEKGGVSEVVRIVERLNKKLETPLRLYTLTQSGRDKARQDSGIKPYEMVYGMLPLYKKKIETADDISPILFNRCTCKN